MNLISRNSKFFLLFFVLSLAKFSYGQTIDSNIRESCRKRVSGLYLTTWNRYIMSERAHKLTSENLLKTNKAIEENETKLDKILKSDARKKFDYKIAEEEQILTNLIKSLKYSQSQQIELASKSKTNFTQSKHELNDLQNRIQKIFHIKKVGVGKEAQSYDIQFVKACPKYRYVCPLSREDAAMLKNIFTEDNFPEDCQKYAGYFN